MTISSTPKFLQCAIPGIPEYSHVICGDYWEPITCYGSYSANFLRSCSETIDEAAQECAKSVLADNLGKSFNSVFWESMLMGGAVLATVAVGSFCVKFCLKSRSDESQQLTQNTDDENINYGTGHIVTENNDTIDQSCFSFTKNVVSSFFHGLAYGTERGETNQEQVRITNA